MASTPQLASSISRERSRRELRLFLRRLAQLGVAIGILVVAGTMGFVLTEGVSALHGFEWTLDTAATVGSIPPPHSEGGKLVKLGLIVFGVGTLFYALVAVTEVFVAGHLAELLEERRDQKMIDELSDHFIICGFGRVGRQAARDLRGANAAFVVIDHDPSNRERAQADGIAFIEGEPSNDDVLMRAGILRARGVVAAVDSDAENIFVTLTARDLRADIDIVARASVEDSERKLKRAGANRVISPYKASGTEMARLALHPQLAETTAVDVGGEYRLEEVEVSAGCAGVNRPINDIRGGAHILALRRRDGAVQPQPAGDVILAPGDVIVAAGNGRTLDRLEALFAPAGRGPSARAAEVETT